MSERSGKYIQELLRPWWVRWSGGTLAVIGAYDTLASQFDLPNLRAVFGMSGSLLPWWGWLLILQALFVAALFEFVRRNVSVQGKSENFNEEIPDWKREIDRRLDSQLKQIAVHAAELVGVKENTKKRLDSLDYAISAIGHRDILLRYGEKLETSTKLLDYPDDASLADADAWAIWERAHSEWNLSMQHWLVHVSPYIKDVNKLVEDVGDGWYEREWPIDQDDFPSLAALRKYQRWQGERTNWQNVRDRAMSAVTGVAFYGKLPYGVGDNGDG